LEDGKGEIGKCKLVLENGNWNLANRNWLLKIGKWKRGNKKMKNEKEEICKRKWVNSKMGIGRWQLENKKGETRIGYKK